MQTAHDNPADNHCNQAQTIEAVCPLCHGAGEIFYQKKQLYHRCSSCHGIFLDRRFLLDREAELKRYREHNNDVSDPRYRDFVSPITGSILEDFTPQHKGLDFGSGSGPVISTMLSDNRFQIEQYDPFFADFPALLCRKYDYVVCCEVIEHFHDPNKEFNILKNLLLPGGKLYCMTALYAEEIDFDTWYYKNDPSHTFFYHPQTISWIEKHFGFSGTRIEGRVVLFYHGQ